MSNFTCNKCGGTNDAETSPTGAAVSPMQEIPFSNDYWKKIQSIACSSCWAEWKEMEVKVINEYRLNMIEREHRQTLKRFMHDFLNVDGTSESAGQAPQAVASEWTPES
ncbi:MAG: hypothetical protein CMP23_11235 [Rickettsiales bacterium]|nr:hypothetical protein [Rickettsiales bacterium]|tara:strand:+ start:6111 stop:6437 length:327 start_codon:yes stop_codon:yes gene_type:complete